METESTLSKSIRAADDKSQYDSACKRLLSEKYILAWIMKSCLDEYRELPIEDIVHKYIVDTPQISTVAVNPDETIPSLLSGTGVEDVTINEGTVKYDIRFVSTVPASGELIKLIVNLEAQNNYNPGYPLLKRAIYYCSRLLSAQHGTEFVNSEYGKIKKVYSIWICPNPPKNRESSITRYSLREDNIVGDVRENIRNYDLLSVVMICLGDNDSDNAYNSILRLLKVLLSQDIAEAKKRHILANDYNIPMTEVLRKELNLMCNLSDGIEARGIEKGMAKGMAKGRAEGMNLGQITAYSKMLAAYTQAHNCSIEDAIAILNVDLDPVMLNSIKENLAN